MSTPGRFKADWAGRSAKAIALAAALNQSANWRSLFAVEPPLETMISGESIVMRLRQDSGSPFAHPWRIELNREASPKTYTVSGGSVHDGRTWHTVAGIAETTLPETLKVWLRVKYYNDPQAASEFELVTGSDWDESSYAVDVIPGTPISALPIAGWSETIIPIGLAGTDTDVAQYQHSDIILEQGPTVVAPRYIGPGCVTGAQVAWMVPELIIRGIVRSHGNPYSVAVPPCGSDSIPSGSSASSGSGSTPSGSSGSSGPEFLGAGWYCTSAYADDGSAEGPFGCDVLTYAGSAPTYFADQAAWDAAQFGVCKDIGDGIHHIRNETDGIRYDSEAACAAACGV